MRNDEIMSQDELQRFYDNNKDCVIKFKFYECESFITLHNLIELIRNVDIVEEE